MAHEAAARAAFERESERVWGPMEAQVWEIFEMFDTNHERRLDQPSRQHRDTTTRGPARSQRSLGIQGFRKTLLWNLARTPYMQSNAKKACDGSLVG